MRKSRIACFVLLTLSLFFVAETKVLAQETFTTINWQVRLDNPQHFSFRSISIGVYYLVDDVSFRQSSTFVTPDADGRFSISVPVGRRITVAVNSSDPTIRHFREAEDEFGYYTLGEIKWEILGWIEFVVPIDAPKQMERRIDLRRGAAFVLNIPSQLTSGTVTFRKTSWQKKDGLNVILFNEGSSIHNDVVGGLEVGEWLVSYYDGNDKELKTRKMKLSSGQIVTGN